MKYMNKNHAAIVITTAVILSGCQLPDAEIISADTSVAMQPVKFDMQFAETTDDIENEVKSYLWDFGDGQKLYGKSAYHVFTKAGNYDVTLTVFGNNGQSGSVTKNIRVTEQETSIQSPLVVKVRHDDVFLDDAEVTIGDKTIITDAEGKADFGNYSSDIIYTVKVKKEGFLDQTYRVEPSNKELPHELHVRLKPVATTNTTEETILKTTINEPVLNTKISYNQSAFTNSNTNLVVTPASFDSESDRHSFAGNTRSVNNNISWIMPLVSIDISADDKLKANESIQIKFETPIRINSFLSAPVISNGVSVWQYFLDENSGLWVRQGEANIEMLEDKDIVTASVSQSGKWAWVVQRERLSFGNLVQTDKFCEVKRPVEVIEGGCDVMPDGQIACGPSKYEIRTTHYMNATAINDKTPPGGVLADQAYGIVFQPAPSVCKLYNYQLGGLLID